MHSYFATSKHLNNFSKSSRSILSHDQDPV